MDPLSISASLIALLQATSSVISLCYDFRAVLTSSPWSLTRVIDEVKSLRNILETLEQLSRSDSSDSKSIMKRRPVFELLCDPGNGPLVRCERELRYLEEKIIAPLGKGGGKRKALCQAMGWRLKDGDASECLERIERCKSTLALAISADEA